MFQWTWLTLLAVTSVKTDGTINDWSRYSIKRISEEPLVYSMEMPTLQKPPTLASFLNPSPQKREKRHLHDQETPAISIPQAVRQRRCHAAERHLRNFRNQPSVLDENNSVEQLETTKRDTNSTYGHHGQHSTIPTIYTAPKKDYNALKDYLSLMHQMQRDAYNTLQNKLKETITRTKQPWRDDHLARLDKPSSAADPVWNAQNHVSTADLPTYEDYQKWHGSYSPPKPYEPVATHDFLSQVHQVAPSNPQYLQNSPIVNTLDETAGLKKLSQNPEEQMNILPDPNYMDNAEQEPLKTLETLVDPNHHLKYVETEQSPPVETLSNSGQNHLTHTEHLQITHGEARPKTNQDSLNYVGGRDTSNHDQFKYTDSEHKPMETRQIPNENHLHYDAKHTENKPLDTVLNPSPGHLNFIDSERKLMETHQISDQNHLNYDAKHTENKPLDTVLNPSPGHLNFIDSERKPMETHQTSNQNHLNYDAKHMESKPLDTLPNSNSGLLNYIDSEHKPMETHQNSDQNYLNYDAKPLDTLLNPNPGKLNNIDSERSSPIGNFPIPSQNGFINAQSNNPKADAEILPTIIVPNEKLQTPSTSQEDVHHEKMEKSENITREVAGVEHTTEKDHASRPVNIPEKSVTMNETMQKTNTPSEVSTPELHAIKLQKHSENLAQKMKKFNDRKKDLDEMVASILKMERKNPTSDPAAQADLQKIMESIQELTKESNNVNQLSSSPRYETQQPTEAPHVLHQSSAVQYLQVPLDGNTEGESKQNSGTITEKIPIITESVGEQPEQSLQNIQRAAPQWPHNREQFVEKIPLIAESVGDQHEQNLQNVQQAAPQWPHNREQFVEKIPIIAESVGNQPEQNLQNVQQAAPHWPHNREQFVEKIPIIAESVGNQPEQNLQNVQQAAPQWPHNREQFVEKIPIIMESVGDQPQQNLQHIQQVTPQWSYNRGQFMKKIPATKRIRMETVGAQPEQNLQNIQQATPQWSHNREQFIEKIPVTKRIRMESVGAQPEQNLQNTQQVTPQWPHNQEQFIEKVPIIKRIRTESVGAQPEQNLQNTQQSTSQWPHNREKFIENLRTRPEKPPSKFSRKLQKAPQATTAPYQVILLKDKDRKNPHSLKPVKKHDYPSIFLRKTVKHEEPYQVVEETIEPSTIPTTESPEERLIKLLANSAEPEVVEEIRHEMRELKRFLAEDMVTTTVRPIMEARPTNPNMISTKDKIIIPFDHQHPKIIMIDPNEEQSKQIQFVETPQNRLSAPVFSFPGGDPFENDNLAKSAPETESSEGEEETEDYQEEKSSDGSFHKQFPWNAYYTNIGTPLNATQTAKKPVQQATPAAVRTNQAPINPAAVKNFEEYHQKAAENYERLLRQREERLRNLRENFKKPMKYQEPVRKPYPSKTEEPFSQTFPQYARNYPYDPSMVQGTPIENHRQTQNFETHLPEKRSCNCGDSDSLQSPEELTSPSNSLSDCPCRRRSQLSQLTKNELSDHIVGQQKKLDTKEKAEPVVQNNCSSDESLPVHVQSKKPCGCHDSSGIEEMPASLQSKKRQHTCSCGHNDDEDCSNSLRSTRSHPEPNKYEILNNVLMWFKRFGKKDL